MNHLDINKAQFQMYGDQCIYKQIDQDEKSLLRTLIEEMTRSGKYEDAIKKLLDTIEDMQKDIQEMKK